MARQRKMAGHSPPAFHLETLERRILFSADAAWAVFDIMPEPDAALVTQLSHNERAANDDAFQASDVRTKELLIVDSAFKDRQSLLNDLNRTGDDNLQVVVLDTHTDALSQIGNLLAQQQGLSAVHVLSDSASSALELGGQQIDAMDFLSRADDVAQWGSALAPDADFFLYGSEEAAVGIGQQIVDTMARLTGAEVSASTDLKGFAERGGDWQLAEHATEDSQPYEVVFLDTGVENYQLLLDDFIKDTQTRNIEVVFLDQNRDGISTITETLLQKRDIDAVHILSHGSDQAVQLGATRLSQSNLDVYASQIVQWQSSLSEDADLLFYGCDLAAHASGQSLLESLSALTLADVAASVDLTGSASRGGDWDLEYSTGQIEIDVAVSNQVQNDWSGLLDITSDLVLHLALEESSGSAAQDSTANNNDGTLLNGVAFSTDNAVGSRSYDFSQDASGSNALVSVADDVSLDFSGDFTVSFWYNTDVAQADSTRLVGSHDGTSGFSIFADADGSLNLFIESTEGSTATLSRAGGLTADGDWHHVSVTRTGADFSIYVDEGRRRFADSAFGSETVNPSAALTIGGESSTISDYEGKIDDVRVYTRELLRSEVRELFALGVDDPPPGYQDVSGGSNGFEWLTSVTYAGIDNTTGKEIGGYGNYTDTQIATIVQGESNDLTIGYNYDERFPDPQHIVAWIDWNQDGDFLDADEEVYTFITPLEDGAHTISVDTPTDAMVGSTIMRVALDFNVDPISNEAPAFGEVEDYAIAIENSSKTFTVTNTRDDGSVGSLRWAIDQANANLAADTIDFNIAGSGTQVITLSSQLNDITDTVTIDGTTQTGWVAGSFLPIVLDGNGASKGFEFRSNADGSILRGLVIRDFDQHAIDIVEGGANIVVAGNMIGQFNSDGTDAGSGEEVTSTGVRLRADDVTIGGSTQADRNLISVAGKGVLIRGNAMNTVVSGNYIGTDISGAAIIGSNNDYGIFFEDSASGAIIGGASAAHGNVIAGMQIDSVTLTGEDNDNITIQNNIIGVSADGTTQLDLFGGSGSAIYITNGGDNNQILDNLITGARTTGIEIDQRGISDGTVIQGNIIGTDASGSQNWGVGESGILIENATNTLIGGVVAGEGNTVAYSGKVDTTLGVGIVIQDGGLGNTIRGNSIQSNANIGIDLTANDSLDGANANDAGDTDTGSNNLQNWAVPTSAAIGSDGTFSYELDTTTLASGTYTIDFYASTDLDGGQVEGARYIGTLTGVAGGNPSLVGTLSGITMAAGEFLTLVTTDSSGNSSEFSSYTVAIDGDSDRVSPYDIRATATTEGGLSINADGGNDIYLIADDSDALLGGQTALSFEIQFASAANANHLTLLSYAAPTNADELLLQIEADGSVTLQVAGSTVHSTAFDYLSLRDGFQHALGFTWDGSSGHWVIYVDGEVVDSHAISGGTLLASGQAIEGGGILLFGQKQTTVGGGFSDTQSFVGTLYNARIFDDIRTAVQVLAGYQSELQRDEAGLLAQWTFDALSLDGVLQDTVAGNNLSIRHTNETGFTNSDASLTLSVDENARDGTVVGSVYGLDPQRESRIATLLSANANLHYSVETGKFYEYVGTAKTWADALADAQTSTLDGVNGNLVTIRSATENQFVIDILNFHGGERSWLGASDQITEGQWHWYDAGVADELFWLGGGDGVSVDGAYQNWEAPFPDNNLNLQHNAWIVRATGTWDDVEGTRTQNSIIEYDADAVLDFTDALSYDITSQTVAGAFEIDTNTGEIRVRDGVLLDLDALDEVNFNSHNVDVEVVDAGGNSYTETMTIRVDNGFELVQTVPALQSIVEDTALTFTAGLATQVSVTDTLGSTDSFLQVSLSVNDGVLSLSSTEGITFVEGADGSSSMIFNGAESAINSALDGMTFTPNAEFNGSVTLNMTTRLNADLVGHYTFDDMSANDLSAGIAHHGVFNGDAATTNDAERGNVLVLDGVGDSVQVSGTYADSENVTLAAWVNLASADANGSELISLGDNVVLRVDDPIRGGLVGYYYDGTSWVDITATGVTIAGTGWNHIAYVFDDTNDSHALYLNGVAIAASATSSSVSYANGADTFIGSHGNADTSYEFNGLIDDARVYSRALTPDEIVGLANGPTEVSDSVAISVDALNDAPVLDNTGTMAFTPVTEDDFDNAGQTVASVIASAGGDRITDIEADPEGIAITAHNPSVFNAPFDFSLDGGSNWTGMGIYTGLEFFNPSDFNASFEFSLDGGSSWIDMGVYTDSESLLLRATDLIRFVPQGAVAENASLEFRAWDQSSGIAGSTTDTSSNGGSTPFSSAVETATMSTIGLNDAPQFGSPDTVQTGLLDGNPTYIEDGIPVVLDADLYVFDRDLANTNYNGTTLTLVRDAGANPDDVFSGSGSLGSIIEGGNLVVDGATIGSVTANSGGTLQLTFNSLADQARINEAVSQIAYSNINNTPPASVQIDWVFDDGNDGVAQGSGGALQAVGSTIVDITPSNDTPVGVPVIAGIVAEDETLTADTSGISDADGVGTFSYQWQRDGADIAGATEATYTTEQADVGSAIKVVASYTDDEGTEESVSSAATANVVNVNDVPTGSVTIDNTAPAQGDLLTASNDLADEDGLGTIGYQWQRDGADIAGATEATYTTVQADVGSTILVVARYTDDEGSAESVSSAATANVVNTNDAPTGSVTIDNIAPAQGDLLTASNDLADEDGLGAISYQWQRDGADIAGATEATYTTVQADVGSAIKVVASYTDGDGAAEHVASSSTAAVTNVNEAPAGVVTIDNTTPTEGDLLSASNTLTDEDGLGTVSYQWQRDGADITGATGVSYTTVQADVGTAIKVVASYTDDEGTEESVSSAATANVVNVNDAPTGSVTIDNTAPAQGDLLTASNDLADEDGLGTISYQWQRDGADIVGATEATYTTVQADVGTAVKVVVSYTDGEGAAERVSSMATANVVNVNDAPTGSVTIDNTAPAQGDLLTASNDLADEDGLGTISYQWQRDGTDITGATNASYATVQADVGTAIRVVATYTDGEGNAEGPLFSEQTFPVTNVNDAPSRVAISNSAIQENTDTSGGFSVGTLGTVDVDTNDTFSYTIVGGVDASVFTIGGADLDELILSDGVLNFESRSNYAVTVRTTDAGGLTHDQSIVITVSDVNEVPVIGTDADTGGGDNGGNGNNGDAAVSLSVDENQTDVVRVSAEDEDLDSTLTFSVTGGADQLAFTVNASTGALNFVSPPDFEAQERFEVEVTVTDNGGLSTVQTLEINVQNVNESPIAQVDTLEANENQRLVIDPMSSLLANDVDPEQDDLRLVDFTQPQSGTLTLNAQGMLVYEPRVGFVGRDGFDYVLEDAGGLRVSARVWLDVIALNEPVIAAARPVEYGADETNLSVPEPSFTTSSGTPTEAIPAIDQASGISVAVESSVSVTSSEDTNTSAVALQDPFAALAPAEFSVQTPASAEQPPPSPVIVPGISSLLEQLLQYDLAELDVNFDLQVFEQFQSLELRDAILALRNQIDQTFDQTNTTSTVAAVAPSVIGASLTAGIVTWVMRSGLLLSITVTTAPLWRPLDPVPILMSSDNDEPWYEKGAPVDSSDAASAANDSDNQGLKHG